VFVYCKKFTEKPTKNTYATHPRILARWKRHVVCRKPSSCPSCNTASSPTSTPFL